MAMHAAGEVAQALEAGVDMAGETVQAGAIRCRP